LLVRVLNHIDILTATCSTDIWKLLEKKWEVLLLGEALEIDWGYLDPCPGTNNWLFKFYEVIFSDLIFLSLFV
jgi:hypothetical protein